MLTPNEIGVVAVVVDDEAGVDGEAARAAWNLERVGVPADPLLALVEGDAVALGEQPRRRQARHARADHRDVQRVPRKIGPGAETVRAHVLVPGALTRFA
jgi:hypothetical protein